MNNGNRAFWSIVAIAAAGHAVIVGSVCCVAALVARHLGRTSAATGWIQLLPALTLLTLAALGVGLALTRTVLEVKALRALHRSVRTRRVAAPTNARRAAFDTGLDERVDVLAADQPFAVTYGLGTECRRYRRIAGECRVAGGAAGCGVRCPSGGSSIGQGSVHA